MRCPDCGGKKYRRNPDIHLRKLEREYAAGNSALLAPIIRAYLRQGRAPDLDAGDLALLQRYGGDGLFLNYLTARVTYEPTSRSRWRSLLLAAEQAGLLVVVPTYHDEIGDPHWARPGAEAMIVSVNRFGGSWNPPDAIAATTAWLFGGTAPRDVRVSDNLEPPIPYLLGYLAMRLKPDRRPPRQQVLAQPSLFTEVNLDNIGAASAASTRNLGYEFCSWSSITPYTPLIAKYNLHAISAPLVRDERQARDVFPEIWGDFAPTRLERLPEQAYISHDDDLRWAIRTTEAAHFLNGRIKLAPGNLASGR